ncbi:MAG: hypothetical protein CVV33_08845 [Methanomicrobiales archaeon HGW-Methanomicrobiales-4]|nr:MAG: hypothetical protein CVV33_08845 [Methanomicrobiales archaeon HGW-Methanomicrobiales-4]
MVLHPVLKEGPVIKLAFGIIVFILAMSNVIILSQTSSIYPEETGYNIGTFTTAKENSTYFMTIQPVLETGLLKVTINEQQDWSNQSRALLKVPADAENISFLIMPPNNLITSPEKIAEQTYLTRVPYQEHENLSLAIEKGGLLIIRPDLIENYYGVEFFLPHQIIHRSRSQISLSIPLYYAGKSIHPGLQQVTQYKIQILMPENYELISSVPSPVRFHFIGNNLAIYEFNVDATATDLLINLENRFITKDLQNIQILLGTLIGFSTSLIISQSIEIISRKEEIINKNRKRKDEPED